MLNIRDSVKTDMRDMPDKEPRRRKEHDNKNYCQDDNAGAVHGKTIIAKAAPEIIPQGMPWK